jgi:hypothetical protein
LTYEPIAITGSSFTQSWIKIGLPNLEEPQAGASGAVVAGIASGSAVGVVLLVVITVYLIMNAKNESRTSGDVPDLRGEENLASEPALLDVEEPGIVVPVTSNCFDTVSGLVEEKEDIYI